ncbi:hypothetical protein [Massilia sp. LC238]|uniref:hypothetical protein n=1 Tax=Massilia sp. LC238 TaxID=1502852 RepID=UPI0004E3622A|nr:hypothetical protein [Massilia sp. LC238]KFC76190.1 hypothetical protein FG94_00282 [Massilia sp. LC238]
MKYLYLFFAAMLAVTSAFASPGAHGPNGEHLDGQANSTGASATVPRIETFTEAFELLGHLSGGELSIMIDRYETNEPVLNGVLEVQYKDLKAKAKFHADLGDYAVDDPKFLAAISKPGTHALLFTLVAGEESDLLEGTLTVAEEADDHGHEHGTSRWLLAAIAAAILAAAAVFVVRRRQRKEL